MVLALNRGFKKWQPRHLCNVYFRADRYFIGFRFAFGVLCFVIRYKLFLCMFHTKRARFFLFGEIASAQYVILVFFWNFCNLLTKHKKNQKEVRALWKGRLLELFWKEKKSDTETLKGNTSRSRAFLLFSLICL